MRRIATVVALAAACGPQGGSTTTASLSARYPLAALDDRTLCDRLLERDPSDHTVWVDREPKRRKKVVVSDLHLGPGTDDPRFHGIEDFYSDREWSAMLERESASGPIDLIIAGDFIEFWQIASSLGALPRVEGATQPAGPTLGADQAFAVAAIDLVIAAHPVVFRAIGQLLDRGDHRAIVIAGNHDADLLWPRVQLAIARAVGARDPARLVFVDAASYEHGGVHVAHGHAYDAANRFATDHAPFGRDREGRCRLETNWGEVFVDRFYTETERQLPFIDNLYPESAAILWALRDNPDPQRDLGAAYRMFDLVRAAHSRSLNRDAVGAALQTVLGGDRRPESLRDILDHITERLTRGDGNAIGIVRGLMRLHSDPELAAFTSALIAAAQTLPDVRAAFAQLKNVDPRALAKLRDELLGDPLESAAQRVLDERAVDIVVLGHNHLVGGTVKRLTGRRSGYYANTGSWIAVASVAELRAKGISWDRLSLADRAMFPSKLTTVVIEYSGDAAQPPVVRSGAP